jgi:lipid II:glycine glycyltransferase (peptidoglycan interpeptide bridge formation enzyme)
MLEINRNVAGLFKTAEIWFSDKPKDIKGYHSVTFRQCKVNNNYSGYNKTEFTTLVIDLTRDLDDIWKDLSPKSCRYKINRAIREGVIVKRSEDYEEFWNLYREFTQQKGVGFGGYTIEQLKQFGTLFMAEFDGEYIAGQLYLEDRENKSDIRLLLGGSRRFGNNTGKSKIIGFANRLLVWEVIKYAKNKGISEFDFGGFYTGNKPDVEKENINTFKKGFGGNIVIHYEYNKQFSIPYKALRSIYRIFKK